MRNLFDQYAQPENRLTHALLSCLSRDEKALKRFIAWTTGERITSTKLEVIEQSLPGEAAYLSEDEAERRGLPDGCIADGEGWALLIESKFAAAVKADQLRRHLRTAKRHGLDRVKPIAVGAHRR